MNISAFRLQLAIALGLPIACTKTTPPGAIPNAKGMCAKDQVHEWVCGLTDPASTVARAGAPAPYESCGVNAIPLAQFDDFVFIDSSLWGNHDPALATFRFDLERTKKYKYGGPVDPGDTWCCYQRCESLQVVAPRGPLPKGMFPHEVCVPAPEAGTSAPAKKAPQCAAGLKLRLELPDKTGHVDNAPFERVGDKGECCYTVASNRKCPTSMSENANGDCVLPDLGRPLREHGVPILARSASRADWAAPMAVAPNAYAALAWRRAAAAEHASVAAFARLAIDLMILGAPPSLVDDAHVAARDEIRHAQLSYGLASAFGGELVGPGPLPMSNEARTVTLASLVSECFFDGCIGETVAAMAAAEARARALPGPVRDALDAIAVDEARHAELAYRIVAWALRTGGQPVRDQLAADLSRVHDDFSITADPPGFDERFGVLSQATARAVRRRVIASIVIPCTEALLAEELV